MKVKVKTKINRSTRTKITKIYGKKKAIDIPPENCTYDAWKSAFILKIDNIIKIIPVTQPLTKIERVKITWNNYKLGEATIEIEGKYENNTVGIDPGTNDMITLVDVENMRVLRVNNNGETKRLWTLLNKDKNAYRRELERAVSSIVNQILEYATKYNIKRVAIGLGPAGNPREKNTVFYDFTEELINQLLFMLPRAGIEVKTVDEYLTSRVDAFSLESFTKKKFKGRRYGKHFYSPVVGRVDADVNAALNIIRKAYGDEVIVGFIRAWPNVKEVTVHLSTNKEKAHPAGLTEKLKKIIHRLLRAI